MDRQCRSRLTAAQATLGKQVLGTDAHTSMSNAQLNALKELVSKDVGLASLSAASVADLQEKAADVNWADGHLAEAIALLSQKAACDKKEHAQRRSMQSFSPALLSFFTESDWDILLGRSVRSGERLELVMRRAAELSTRNLSEPSSKFLASFLMYLEDPSAGSVSSSKKRDWHTGFKLAWKRHVRPLRAQDPYLLALPSDPEELAREHPELFKQVFPQAQPVPVPAAVKLTDVVALDTSYTCRGGQVQPAAGVRTVEEGGTVKCMLDAMVRMQELSMESRRALPSFPPPEPKSGALEALASAPGSCLASSMKTRGAPPARLADLAVGSPVGDRQASLGAASQRVGFVQASLDARPTQVGGQHAILDVKPLSPSAQQVAPGAAPQPAGSTRGSLEAAPALVGGRQAILDATPLSPSVQRVVTAAAPTPASQPAGGQQAFVSAAHQPVGGRQAILGDMQPPVQASVGRQHADCKSLCSDEDRSTTIAGAYAIVATPNKFHQATLATPSVKPRPSCAPELCTAIVPARGPLTMIRDFEDMVRGREIVKKANKASVAKRPAAAPAKGKKRIAIASVADATLRKKLATAASAADAAPRQRATVAASVADAKTAACKNTSARIDHERSRSQFLVRLGKGKGSVAFKYTNSASQRKAQADAKAALKRARR